MKLRVSPLILLSALSCLLPSPGARAQGDSLLYTIPFRAGDHGARLYRIPALWSQPGQPLLAFAERRMEQRRMFGDVDVVLRRSLDHGDTWQALQIVANLGRDTCGNPCVVQDASNGRLWLAFTRSRNHDTEEAIVAGTAPGTEIWITFSKDQGATWSAPRNISASARRPNWGWYGTGPGQGLYLAQGRSGRLLIPAYHTEDGVYRTHALFSDDHGETWQLGADAADHTSEPQVIEVDRDTLLMNARTISGHGPHRTLLTSRDRGVTWQPARDLAPLIENNCQGTIYRAPRAGSTGQSDLLFAHPLSPDRTDVHAWISEDGGRSWPAAQKLWSGPSAYTALTSLPGGSIGMLVECGATDVYEQIAFVRFATGWLKTGTPPESAPAPLNP